MASRPFVPAPGSLARRRLTVVVICMTAVALTIDNSLLSVALPTLSREIGASTSELQWIVDAYLFVFAGLLLMAGNLCDRYGRAVIFRVGLTIYGAASIMGAVAGSALPLILARGLKGVGASLTLPAATAIISNIDPDPKGRARLLGVWTSVSGVGLAVGPVLGGFLLAHLWWGALFLLPVPLVLLGIVGSYFLESAGEAEHVGKNDFLGVVLSIVVMGLFVGVTIRAPDEGWGSASTIVGYALALVALSVFARWELRCSVPMLELRLFRNARFTMANIATAISNVCYIGMVFLTVQYLQIVQGHSPLATGVRMFPLAAAVMIVSILSPRIVDRVGTTRLVVVGLLSSAASLFVLSRIGVTSGYLPVAFAMTGVGVGLGLLFPAAIDAVMGSVPREQAGVASGTASTMRQTGNAMGIAIFGSALASGYRAAIGGVAVTVGLTAAQLSRAEESSAQAFAVAKELPARDARILANAAADGFVSGMRTGMLIGVGLLVICAVLTARWLPARVEVPA